MRYDTPLCFVGWMRYDRIGLDWIGSVWHACRIQRHSGPQACLIAMYLPWDLTLRQAKQRRDEREYGGHGILTNANLWISDTRLQVSWCWIPCPPTTTVVVLRTRSLVGGKEVLGWHSHTVLMVRRWYECGQVGRGEWGVCGVVFLATCRCGLIHQTDMTSG